MGKILKRSTNDLNFLYWWVVSDASLQINYLVNARLLESVHSIGSNYARLTLGGVQWDLRDWRLIGLYSMYIEYAYEA